MSVLVVISGEKDAAPLTRWGVRFASACKEPLVILYGERGTKIQEPEVLEDLVRSDDPVIEIIRTSLAQDNPANIKICVKHCASPDRAHTIKEEIDALKPRILVLGKQRSSRDGHADAVLARTLFDHATCQTIMMRFGDSDGTSCERILIPTAGGPHAVAALKTAAAISETYACQVVPLYIEPKGDELAADVGEAVLAGILRKAGVAAVDPIQPRVILSNSISQGITQVAQEGCDLIMVGATRKALIRQALFGTVPDRLLVGKNNTAIALVKAATPLHHRISDGFERWLDLTVPQLERGDRIALFEGLQNNSRWNFDFLALIGLSTAIATLGLIQDSAAVVIGAMLVAPLMSPLLGCGLAITQGNFPLFRSSMKSITLGFLVALSIGLFLGWISPLDDLTRELRARGGPSLLDVGVAFLSGIAAAYCTGRPNLSGALPGVAIAAALVPPIATVGVSLSLMQFSNAQGAALLFATNVVCIILGSSIAFFAGGVRARAEEKRSVRWVHRTILGLVLAVIVFSVPLTTVIYDQFKNRSPIKLSKELKTEMRQELNNRLQAKLIRTRTAHHDNDQLLIELTIRSPRVPDLDCTTQLADIVRKHLKREVRVRIETELMIEAGNTEEAPSFKASPAP